jgi:DNA helicase-2/ATP-dependent DNA helicase PcrA
LETGATRGGETSSGPPLAEQVERVRDFYDPICRRVYDNGAIRLRDIEQLAHIAAGYRSRSRFITDLTLDPPAATSDLAQPPFLEEDYLILSTMHSAKGCEWTAVHVLHAADGMIPSDMATGDAESIDEERRLFYVALTRAKDYLYVYFPLRYYHSRFGHADRHNYGQLTRFMPRKVRTLFDERTPALEEQDEPIEPIEPATVQARLSDLWRD